MNAASPPPAPLTICAGCAAFVPAGPSPSLCPACARAAPAASMRPLYPVPYLVTAGLLTTGALGAALAALDWHRLGEPDRARTCALWSLLGLLGVVILVAFPQLPRPLLFLLNAALVTVCARGLGPRVGAARAAGAPRANLVLPGLILGAVLLAVAYVASRLLPPS